MTCEHLYPLEKELVKAGVKEVFRGKAWSDNRREWVYYECLFPDPLKTRDRLGLDKELIQLHAHPGRHEGHEQGLVCTRCKDGIMGMHPEMVKDQFSPVLTFE